LDLTVPTKRLIQFGGILTGEGVERLFEEAKGDHGKIILWLEQSLQVGLGELGYDVDVEFDSTETYALELHPEALEASRE
jgi:hypothetical protein